jgi:RNA recognition motif-containing protein
LPQETTNEFIERIFGPYGKIEDQSIQKKPHNVTALVKFSTHEEAETAIKECNYIKVNEQQIRVQWQSANPRQHQNEANLVISHLPLSVEDAALHTHFQTYGEVISCKIMRKKDGVSTGTGYVQFARVEDANKALEDLQNATIEGQMIFVDKFKPADQRNEIRVQLPPQALYVEANKGEDFTKEKIETFFKQFGEVEEVMMFDLFSVVFFTTPASTTTACSSMATMEKCPYKGENRVSKGITIQVLKVLESRKVFVSDFLSKDGDQLKKHLEKAGKIVSFAVQERNPGQFLASVTYDSEETQKKAIETLDRTTYEGQPLPIHVLPYVDKNLPHARAGIIMINSLPLDFTYSQLREEFKQYGNIVAVSIAPTPINTLVGFVLFEDYKHAVAAKAQTPRKNVFVFPELDIISALAPFQTSTHYPFNTILLTGISKDKTDAEIVNEFIKYGYMYSAETKIIDQNKIAFIKYIEPKGIINATTALEKSNYKYIVLSANSLYQAFFMISKLAMPENYHERFVFANSIGVGNDADSLYEIFSRNEGKVEAAFPIFDTIAWRELGKAYVLFEDRESAARAIFNPQQYTPELSDFISILPFTNRSTQRQQATPIPPPTAFPAKPITNPRKALRETAKELQISDEDKKKVLAKIEKLSINDSYNLAYNPTNWEKWLKSALE